MGGGSQGEGESITLSTGSSSSWTLFQEAGEEGKAWISSSSSKFNLVQKQILSCHCVGRTGEKKPGFTEHPVCTWHTHIGHFVQFPPKSCGLDTYIHNGLIEETEHPVPTKEFWFRIPESAWLKHLTLPQMEKSKSCCDLRQLTCLLVGGKKVSQQGSSRSK